MKVLKVIHGYPYRYNAGSEVYSQTLCQELVRQGHEVVVFTRQENAYKQEYSIDWETDPICKEIKLCLVNMAHSKDGYRHYAVDQAFVHLLNDYKPDIVHIGHLNHLSTSLISETHRRGISIIFTLHDFWLMCPRGQFLQGINSKTEDFYPACDSQENGKCARQCYWRYFSQQEDAEDIQYWTNWVAKRMDHVREMSSLVDLFIAPSHYLRDRFVNDFHLDPSRIIYLDYGFHRERFQGRIRHKEGDDFVFGYIGTHKQAKGIFHLLQAFSCVSRNSLLKIWGSPLQPFTQSLQSYVKTQGLEVEARIHWMGGYRNDYIVSDVFNHVDAIVIPSIWGENSPLVIHEALEAKVPIITADFGGMKEYVHHELNGLLFKHRNPADLAVQMERLIHDPLLADTITNGGYLQSYDRHIPCIQEHTKQMISMYNLAIERRKKYMISKPGPWRITFDTNPDDCNLRCIMCEEHSIYSTCQTKRKEEGRSRRRMDIELIRKVLEESKNSPLKEIIPSTMGEPLLYRHFDEIIELCHEYRVKLNLTTNGTFPGYGATKWAQKIVPIGSDVKISWNGATKETSELIMIGSNFEKRLQNVKDFIRVRDEVAATGGNFCRVTFQLTFMEIGIEELPDIIRLAASLGVNRVKGHHLWVFAQEMEKQNLRKSKESIQRWNSVVVKALEVAEKERLPDGTKVTLENIYALDESAMGELVPNGVCPFLGREAWVSSEGRFNPCCAPDKERLELGDFGNLHQTSLKEIWESEAYQDLRKNYLKHSVCKRCNMRKKVEDIPYVENKGTLAGI